MRRPPSPAVVRRVVPIASADFPTAARRPANSVLRSGRFAGTFGFRPRHWKDRVDRSYSPAPRCEGGGGRLKRKGIILAGGAGTRLHPLTLATSKQLLPIYDKPMVYYPLSTLMLAGIREILIITTPEDQRCIRATSWRRATMGHPARLCDPAEARRSRAGVRHRGGIPCAAHTSCLVLGDNLLYGHGLPDVLRRATARRDGATIFGYRVEDPRALWRRHTRRGRAGDEHRGEAHCTRDRTGQSSGSTSTTRA